MNIALAVLAAGTIISVKVDTAPSHVLNNIRPLRAIGTGIDSDPPRIKFLYAPDRTKQMLEAGLGFVSYRLYTELSIQDWHWNPSGSFSAGNEGYWTSSGTPTSKAIVDSYGYHLPHRGSTRDQGDDDNYSRIDDGDPKTYWKSDPYLASRYTGDPDSAHPQWAVIDLEAMHAVDAIQIAWANPYATHYLVQYWVGNGSTELPNGSFHQPPGTSSGEDVVDAIVDQSHGTWHTFANGDTRDGRGGDSLLRLSQVPVQTHWVRVLMDASSGTCDTHGSSDPRNCVGYAIQDVSLGQVDATGTLHDLIRHNTCGGNPMRQAGCRVHQTSIYVSSNDPWHGESDRVGVDQDQPGLDVIGPNPITRHLPTMYPVAVFYSTPENAANEVRYLEARRYPVGEIEMGEEVDGQYAMPEDYAALYLEFAKAIHRVDPKVKLGGPIFEGVNSDVPVWRDASGDVSWFHRFIRYLIAHGRLQDLAFMSFEHYPFRGCDQGGALYEDLLLEPALVRGIVDTWHADGLPKNVPMFMTEVNFANDGGPVPKQLAGALWMADWVGTSLSSGVSGLNYYQYEAEPTGHKSECNKWGSYGLFIVDDNFRILAKASQFWAARMLTHEWLSFGDDLHGVYPASTDLGATDVTAYAAKRPDGSWSVMLVNKDPASYKVRLAFGSPSSHFAGPVQVVTFGSAQYHWAGNKQTELPSPNTGPQQSTAAGGADATYTLAPESITVIRGKLAP